MLLGGSCALSIATRSALSGPIATRRWVLNKMAQLEVK